MALYAAKILEKTDRKEFSILISKKMAPYIFILPFFIFFGFFGLGALGYALWLSFYKAFGVVIPPTFIGLKNYIFFFTNAKFLNALKVTFTYTVAHVCLMTGMATVLALLLNMKIRGRIVFRIIYIMPAITSLVAATMVFRLIFAERIGFLNILLEKIGLPPQGWLNDPRLALLCLVLIATWRWFGWNTIILLAGLQGIPAELYEVAKIDGASTLQIILRITLPLLFPMIFFVMIMSTIGSLQVFDEIYILTGGGPCDATNTLGFYLYSIGFSLLRLGRASAMGYIIAFIIFSVSYLQVRLLSKRAFFD